MSKIYFHFDQIYQKSGTVISSFYDCGFAKFCDAYGSASKLDW